jgi:hypothetical protein
MYYRLKHLPTCGWRLQGDLEEKEVSYTLTHHRSHSNLTIFAVSKRTPVVPLELDSKIQAIQESIQRHLADRPKDKLILFDDLRYSATMTGHILQEIRIKYGYYFSYPQVRSRTKVLMAFEKDPGFRVMVRIFGFAFTRRQHN